MIPCCLCLVTCVLRKTVAFNASPIPFFTQPRPPLRPRPRHHTVVSLIQNNQHFMYSRRITPFYMGNGDSDECGNQQLDDDDEESHPMNRDELMKIPISILLSKLTENDIRIPPTANRKDLVQMILEHYKLQQVQTNRDIKIVQRKVSEDAVRKRLSQTKRGVRRKGDPDPMQDDEEYKYKRRTRTPPPSRFPNGRMGDIRTKSQGQAMKSRREIRRERNDQLGGVWDDAFIPTAKEATRWGMKAVDGATNVAKVTTDDLGRRLMKLKRSRRAIDEDNDGAKVKEADWFYVSKDEDMLSRSRPISNQSKSTSKSNVIRPNSRRKPKKLKRRVSVGENIGEINEIGTGQSGTKKLKRRVSVGEQIGEINEIGTGQSGNKLLALPPTLDGVVYMPDLNQGLKNDEQNGTNPALPIYYQKRGVSSNDWNAHGNYEDDSKRTKTRRPNPRISRQRLNRTSNAKKKVYSVYPEGKDDFDLEEIYGKAAAGAIDSVGEFLADVASGEYGKENKTASWERNSTSTANEQQKESEQIPKRRYWRDRLAERVDLALGVHEDGGYYKSWQDRHDREHEQESEGNDPVSIFYGKQKKRRRSKTVVGPFWEKDGSLKSLLFGRNSDDQQLAFNVSFCVSCKLSILTIVLMLVVHFVKRNFSRKTLASVSSSKRPSKLYLQSSVTYVAGLLAGELCPNPLLSLCWRHLL